MATSDNSANMERYAGYEEDFQPEVESKYQCPVCLTTMREAVQTKCGHRFCKYCLKQSTSKTRYSRCPVDNTWFDTTKDVFNDTAIQREIQSLTVLCSNHIDDCTWTGELRRLNDHMKQCPQVKVACPNKCGRDSEVRRGTLEQHLLICPQRLESCLHCSKTLIAAYMAKHQLLVCEKFPVSCGVCGETGIIRDQVAMHVDLLKGDCPLVTIKCAFEYVGCYFQDKRKNMWTHYEEACHEHMLLLCYKLAEHDEKLNNQIQQVHTITQQQQLLKQTIIQQDKLIRDQSHELSEREKRSSCSLLPVQWTVEIKDADSIDYHHIRGPVLHTGYPGYKLAIYLELPDNDNGTLKWHVSLQKGCHDQQLKFPFNGFCNINFADKNAGTSFRISGLEHGDIHTHNDEKLSLTDITKENAIYLHMFVSICTIPKAM